MADKTKFRPDAILDVARFYVRFGLSVIPIRADGSKAPALARGEVEQYRERFATIDELTGWFASGRAVGLAIVCGKISGNLAVLDFESQQAWQNWQRRCEELGLTKLYESFPRVVTPRGGRHIYCRLRDGWAPGGKLAMRSKSETLVEIRGQGHYVLAPGCPGACHELNREYEFESRGWIGQDGAAPMLTLDDYEALCNVAKEFNEYVTPERVRVAAPASSDAKGSRPGDEFNRRATWSEILEPHGWKVEKTYGEVTYWTRPGKGRGVSATTGKCSNESSGDLLYVFTSNTEFEQDHAYSKFAAIAILEHSGDFSAAASRLAEQGYKAPEPVPFFSEPVPQPNEEDDVAGIDDLRNAGACVKWLWPGWIQNGVVTAVAAQGGTGKTRFMADLVRRVRNERVWPDGSPVEHPIGRTVALWVVSDNHHDEMVTLCEAFGISDCVKVNAPKADPYAGVTLEALEEFAALERRVKAVKPVFVVIDTVGNATDRNLSRQEDAKSFYQPLQLIARRQNVAVMALTHLNAGGKVLGRRALEKVRICIRMNAPDTAKEAKRRLEVIKSNSIKPAALGISMTDGRNNYDNDPPPAPEDPDAASAPSGPPTKVKECAEWLMERLEDAPVKLTVLIQEAEEKGMSRQTLYRAKDHLGIAEAPSQGFKWWGLKKSSKPDS